MFGVKKCSKTRIGDTKSKVVEDFKKIENPTDAEIRRVRKVMVYDPRDAH